MIGTPRWANRLAYSTAAAGAPMSSGGGPVLEHMQQSRHILLDTRIEQLLDDVVTTQFRNVGGDELPDVMGHVEDVVADRRGDL